MRPEAPTKRCGEQAPQSRHLKQTTASPPAGAASTVLADDGAHQVIMGLTFPLMIGGAPAAFFHLVVTGSP